MKGIVFTEFLEMVEDLFDLETVDYIINKSNLKSNGAYTSIGTYDFHEMLALITNLSEKVNIPVSDLIYTFGLYFFNVLRDNHPEIMNSYNDPIDLLSAVENHIHVEVQKIYPEAELPTFDIVKIDDNTIEMIYHSKRGLYMLAKALITKTFEHYNQLAEVSLELLNEKGTEVRFLVQRKNGTVN